jgi:4-alpha-glucanotransferase
MRRLIDRDAMWRVKMQALWVDLQGRPAVGAPARPNSTTTRPRCGDDFEAYATWCLCYDKWGKPENTPDNWINKYTKDSPEVAQLREQFPRHCLNSTAGSSGLPPSSCMRPSRRHVRPA